MSITEQPTGFHIPSSAREGIYDDALLWEVVAQHRRDGYVFLENVYDPAYIEGLQRAYFERYIGTDYEEVGWNVGDKRWMINVALEPPFDDPLLYAHPFVLDVLAQLMGAQTILNAFGSVVSLPGSDVQHPHSDHPRLFEDQAINAKLPIFATTVVVPLVDLTPDVGSTGIWPGTHVHPKPDFGTLADLKPALFVAPMGSVYLMDYCVKHAGLPNESERERPIMYAIYSRPWFTDFVNYEKVRPLQMTQEAYDRVPKHLRSLFSRLQMKPTIPDEAPAE